MSLKKLRDAIKEKKLFVGTGRTIKALKKGEAKEVFLSKNCLSSTKDEIKKLAELSKVEYVELELTNEELGAACKKPFSIDCCYC
jgi:ribosomal protein L30E